jgi:hypothetical protein
MQFIWALKIRIEMVYENEETDIIIQLLFNVIFCFWAVVLQGVIRGHSPALPEIK